MQKVRRAAPCACAILLGFAVLALPACVSAQDARHEAVAHAPAQNSGPSGQDQTDAAPVPTFIGAGWG